MRYEILGLLSASKTPLSLTQISNILGKPKNKVFDVLETLVSEGQIKEVYLGIVTCYEAV